MTATVKPIEWKPGLRMWEHHNGTVYETDVGRFVAASGGCYLPGEFLTHWGALKALDRATLATTPGEC